jgi:hypothetical protein
MIDHVWTVLCQRSLIDRNSNNVTLIEIIEQLNITGREDPIVVQMPMELVSLWTRRDPETRARGRYRISFIEPDNAMTLEPYVADIDLTNHSRFRTRARMGGFPIRRAGRHKFRVDLQVEGEEEWRQIVEVPVQVNIEPVEG